MYSQNVFSPYYDYFKFYLAILKSIVTKVKERLKRKPNNKIEGPLLIQMNTWLTMKNDLFSIEHTRKIITQLKKM